MTPENTEIDAFTPDEQAYMDSQGMPPEAEETPAVEEVEADEAPATEETAAETEGEQEAEDGDQEARKSDTVPHGAFHAKNEELKATKNKLREIETQMAVVSDRFERFAQMQNERQKAPEPVEEVPGDDDPIGKIAYLEKQLQQVQQGTQEQQAQAQHQRQLADFKQAISLEEQQFSQERPDYTAATQHVGSIIMKNLAARGFQGPQLQERYQNELLTMALDAKEAGRSVPEVVYEMATNWGYQPGGQQAAQEAQPKAAKETLEKVAEGQKVNKTVAATSGASGGKMTLERFAAMSEAESFAWLEKNPDGYAKLSRG